MECGEVGEKGIAVQRKRNKELSTNATNECGKGDGETTTKNHHKRKNVKDSLTHWRIDIR